MKRFAIILLTILLAAAMLAIPASASGESVSVTPSVSGKPGETVYVTVSLNGFQNVASVGVVFNGLNADPAASKWQLQSEGFAVQGISEKDAVFGFDVKKNVSQAALTLAFPIPAEGFSPSYTVNFTIAVKYGDNETYSGSAAAMITVVKPATAITVDQSQIQLKLGDPDKQTAVVTPTVTPADHTDTLTWTSSDPAVATVSNGKITAVGVGQATITVKANDSVQKNCLVTVICDHTSKTPTAEKASTCTIAGNNAYYTCDVCRTVLKADGKTATTVAAETRPLAAHSFAAAWTTDATQHYHLCTVCETAKDQAGEHSFAWVVDKEATTQADGVKHEECFTCKYTRSENTVIPHLHSAKEHAAVAASCSKEGNVQYWTCGHADCSGKYYGDKNCTTVLQTVIVPVDGSNHVHTEVKDAKAPNCYQAGSTGYTWCKDCEKKVKEAETIQATGNHVAASKWSFDGTNHYHACTTAGCPQKLDSTAHAFKWVVDKEATEDTTGVKHEECSCGAKRNENTVIGKLDHKHTGIKHVEAVTATCVKAGNVEYWTCSSSKCAGKFYGDSKCQLELKSVEVPVDNKNHVHTEVKDAAKATCGKAGYTGDTWCKDCKKLVKKGEEIAATGKHTAKGNYLKDNKNHWQECKVCNQVINKTEHAFKWIVDTKPTEGATGLKHEECTTCKQVRNEKTVMDKLSHYPQLVKGTEATCTEDGKAEHYYCGNCGAFYASEEGKIGQPINYADTILKATGHSYGEEWKSDEDNHWQECKCGEVNGLEKHNAELTGVVEASETQEGYTGDTVCSVCGKVLKTGEAVAVLATDPTEAPTTEAPVVETTEAPAQEEEKQSGNGILWIIPVVVVVAAGAFLVIKKRKQA